MNLEDKKLAKVLSKVFPVLTETNKKIVIDLTKFLVRMRMKCSLRSTL